MTTPQALKTVWGAKITSSNVPDDELKTALLVLRSAAARCLVYDKQVDEGELVRVIRCKDCAHNGLFDCPLCYIEKQTLQFIEVSPDFYCGQGGKEALMSKLVKADELKNRFGFLFKWYGQLPCGEEDKLTQRIIKKCIRTLEHNYNVAVSFNENQAKYIDQLQTTAFVAGCNWGYGVDLSAHVSDQEQLGAQAFLGKITTEDALHRRKILFGGDY